MAHQPSDSRSWLILFLCVLSSSGIFSAETLDFTIEPQNVTVPKDQAFVWDCSASGESPINITWKKDGQDIRRDDHWQILRNGSLYFTAVEHRKKKQSDVGTYECFASNKYGIIVSRAYLQIAEKPKFSLQPQSVTTHVGSVARFSCYSDSIPQSSYSWEKDRVSLPDNDRFIILPSGVLQILNIQENDTGNYRCVARNIVSKKRSDEAILTVLPEPPPSDTGSDGKPVFVAGPQNVVKRQGENVILECLVAKSRPEDDEPRITWNKNQNPVDPTRVSYYGDNLQINGLQSSDTGVYTCTAEYGFGDVVQRFGNLQVHTPPVLTKVPENTDSPAAGTARFTCDVDGIPQPTKLWYADGKLLEEGGRISTDKDLVVRNIQRKDGGIYQCVAENAVGKAQGSALLQVTTGEDDITHPKNVTVTAISSTSVKVSWSFDRLRSNVVGYSVHYSKVPGGKEATLPQRPDLTTAEINSLEPFTVYSFYVIAYTSQTPSPPSEEIQVRTMEDVPGEAPTFMLSGSKPRSILVNWEPIPEAERNGIVTKYRIYYSEVSWSVDVEEDSEDVDGHLLQFELGGLKPDTIYSIKMSAFTSAGEGDISNGNVQVRTQTETGDHLIPDTPTNLKVRSLNSTSIELTWMAPSTVSPVPLGGYKLSVNSRSDSTPKAETVELDVTKTSYVLSHLLPCTTYYVKLWAFNDHGDGPIVSSSGIQTRPDDVHALFCSPRKLLPPSGIHAIVQSSTSVIVTWVKPSSSIDIVAFIVKFHPLEEANVTLVKSQETARPSINLMDLVPFTRYTIAVKAIGPNIESSFSPPISVQTLEDRPSPPSYLNAQLYGVQSVLLEWAPPEHPNGIITTYIIMYSWDSSEPDDLWMMDKKEAMFTQSVVENLEPSLEYFFKMKAQTEVGAGPPTEPVPVLIPPPNSTLSKPNGGYQSDLSTATKIVLGVSVGFMCILIIALIIYKKRHGLFQKCKPSTYHISGPACNGHIPGRHPNGNVVEYGVPQPGVELESFSPMLAQMPVHDSLDTKGGSNFPNYFTQDGFHGSSHLPQTHRQQQEASGSSNMTTFAPTSGPAPSHAPTYSENTEKLSESTQPLLCDQSNCPDKVDEDDDDDNGDDDLTNGMISCNSTSAERFNTRQTLPQCAKNCHSSLNDCAPDEHTGLLEAPGDAQTSTGNQELQPVASPENSPTQDYCDAGEGCDCGRTAATQPAAAGVEDVPDSGNPAEKLLSSCGDDTVFIATLSQPNTNSKHSHQQSPCEDVTIAFEESPTRRDNSIGRDGTNFDGDRNHTSFISTV